MADPTEEFAKDAKPFLVQTSVDSRLVWTWTPLCRRQCRFGPENFSSVMENLVHNPNLLSSWLFRADIVFEQGQEKQLESSFQPAPAPVLGGFELVSEKTIVRRLIPRNTLRDKPMLQTCLFYASTEDGHDGGETNDKPSAGAQSSAGDEPVRASLVVYLPHVDQAAEMPFYHPMVRAVGFLHEWQPMAGTGSLSVHFSFFPEVDEAPPGSKGSRSILSRVALSLLSTIHKHGEGTAKGYVKRVHHDQLVPQARVQNRYARLKERHARRLVDTWQETTNPVKHVFEDLAIAAFLMELWADMYGEGEGSEEMVPAKFPGFVDVGCGNGLLVHVLNEEGYRGWGFDARQRRSWQQYGNAGNQKQLPLQKALLLPSFLVGQDSPQQDTHGGEFPPGTFLIANHADELTAWTPVLAALSNCPFIAIPCCSYNFTGAKFRAPPPSAAATAVLSAVSLNASSSSTYASFVAWVMNVAEDCSWKVEYEMLRIPSTRNIGLLGRRRRTDVDGQSGAFTIAQAWDVINKHGGAHGFADNVAKLAADGKKDSH